MDEKTIRESHTIREDRTIREDQTIRETAGTQKDQGTTGETFKDYKIVRQLPTYGREADAYIIEKEGQEYFLKTLQIRYTAKGGGAKENIRTFSKQSIRR